MDSALRGPSLKLGAFSARTHLSVRTILRALTQIETFADLRQRRRVCHCLIQVIADGEQWAAPMDAFIDEVVRRSIRHTRLILRQGSHNWPVARLALRRFWPIWRRRLRMIQACPVFAPLSPPLIAHGCVRTDSICRRLSRMSRSARRLRCVADRLTCPEEC